MSRIEGYLQSLRDWLLWSMLGLIPSVIDPKIVVGAGPQTKFYVFEYGVLLALVLSSLLWSRRGTVRISFAAGTLLLFAGYVAIRAAVDPLRGHAFDAGLQTMAWLLYAWLLADTLQTAAQRRRMLLVLAVTQLFAIVYAVVETFGVDIYFSYIRGQPGLRWQNALVGSDRVTIWTSIGNPNYYAAYAGMFFLWLIVGLRLSRAKRSRSALFLYLAAVLYTLIYSYSRGIIVSLLGTAMVMLAVSITLTIQHRLGWQTLWARYGKPVLAGLGALLVLLLAVYVVEEVRGGGPLHAVGKRFQAGLSLRDASLRARPLMWSGALRMWREQPLVGQGNGQYMPQYLESIYALGEETGVERIQRITRQLNTIRSDRAHNDYVQYLAELGLVGFGLFLLVLLAHSGLIVMRLFQRVVPDEERIWLMGALSVIAMTAIHAVYDFPLRLPASAMMFAVALAVVTAFSRNWPGVSRRLPSPWPLKWAGVAIAVALVIAAQGLILRHYLASHFMTQGNKPLAAATSTQDLVQQRALLENARRFYDRALELYPQYGEALFGLGQTYWFMSQRLGNEPVDYRRLAQNAFDKAGQSYAVPKLYLLSGLVNLSLRNYEPAQRHANLLLMVNPEQEKVQYLAGMVDYRLGRQRDALEHFQIEVKHYPENAEAWWMIGRIYEDEIENVQAAASAYERALEEKPNVVLWHERLARLYFRKLDDRETALQHAERAFELARQLGRQAIIERMRLLLRDIQRPL